MAVTLFHRTTVAGARDIARNGFEDRELEIPLHDARTGEAVPVTGVWLSAGALGPDEGFEGDAQLEVLVDADPDDMEPFELGGLLWHTRFWVVPANWINDRAIVRILSVDASSSGFYDAPSVGPESPE